MNAELNILGYTVDDLVSWFKEVHGKGKFHAAATYKEIFQQGGRTVSQLEEFAKSSRLAEAVEAALRFPVGDLIDTQEDGGVCKFATRLQDGNVIESVVIPHEGRTTLCVSSQVGCKLGCTFCSTGTMGFVRNLSAAEIVNQVYSAIFALGRPIRNIVFMGMGEPLDNLDNVVQAIRVIGEPQGLNIPPTQISVSTAGMVPQIAKLGAAGLPNLKLAISLHTVDNDLRSRLMPINKVYDLTALKEALRNYPLPKKCNFLMEYILLSGVNTSRADAEALAQWCEELPMRINLIPYNPPTDTAEFKRPSEEEMRQFHEWCIELGLFTMVRVSRGDKIAAACGQLRKELEG